MAHICQKCGDPGFQEVMIYCRQCRISCEHKYCLFKFPKKGEKVRWYCEECKPTIFPVSSADKLEDDTERSKIELKSPQTLKNQNQIQYQNQNQNQKTKSLSASGISQLEKVEEKSNSLKPPSSDYGENGQPLKRRRSILSDKDPVDKNVPNTPLVCPTLPTTCGETTVQEEAKSLKSPFLVLGENGQAQKRNCILSNKDQVNQNVSNTPLARSPPPTTCGETIVQEEAKSLKSLTLDFGKNGQFQNRRRSVLSDKVQVNQNVPSTPLAHSSPPTNCGETIVKEDTKNIKSLSNNDENTQFQKLRRPILSNKHQVDQNVPNTSLAHSPLPSTCGKTYVHEVSAPETIVHRNNTHQEIEVYNPEQVDQIDPFVIRPINYYIWRGCISFGDNDFVPFRAHRSTIACQRVSDAALLLPPFLPVDKYLRRDLWPTIFKKGPPTDDIIGLYFLPDDNASLELVFHLIDEIIRKDLMFVYAFDEFELLIFPSCILPKEHHKIQGQYYLWAAFRNKELPTTVTPANDNPEPTIENKENRQDKQEVLACSESQKVAANAMTKLTGNEEEIHDNNLNSPITEKKRLILDGVNKKRVREESENHSKSVTTSDSENQKPAENISKRCKEEEITTSRLSKCIENQRHVQVTKGEHAESKETHASTLSDKSAKQTFADRSKERSRFFSFAKNYVSDFYRNRKTGDEKQRVFGENERMQREEKDEINANDVASSAWTRKQRPAHVLEAMKKFSQNKEKLCPSSPISKSAELQKVADESKKKERNSYETHVNKINGVCTEKQKLTDGQEKLMVSKDEREKNINSLRKSDHCRNQTYASNPSYSLAREKQNPAGTLITKCIEKQKPVHMSKESSKREGEKNETLASISTTKMNVDKSNLKEQKKNVEHAITTPISTCTEKQKLKRAHEGSKLCAHEKLVGSKQLPLEETRKKHERDENEFVSSPLPKGSPTTEKEEGDAETVASDHIEKVTKEDVNNEKISQNVDEAQASPFSSTCTDDQKERERSKNFNDGEELEEGEICDDDFFEREGEIHGSGYNNKADDGCLSLFPLKVEDMGVVSKVGSNAKVSLDLGLGRS